MNPTTEQYLCSYLDVEAVVDDNEDKDMDEKEEGQLSKHRPWFWNNNTLLNLL